MSIIRGVFHRWPAGSRVWECLVCRTHFVWSSTCSRYGNAEYAVAVFCTDACAKRFVLPNQAPERQVMPWILAKDRVHLEPYVTA